MNSKSIAITVTSAEALSKTQIAHITTAVKKKYEVSSVVVEEVVDPSVLGGIKLMINSVEYDGTVQGKLAQVRSQLMNQL
jgi:F-type H+-transporting ATPase subunit delta